MNQNLMDSKTNFDRVIEEEKFDRIIGAILAGKYSWACVLMLRFAGYNPLHYIPYRTYNRLMKNNPEQNALKPANRDKLSSASNQSPSLSSYQIKDLNYLERLSRSDKQLRGGNSAGFAVEWDFWQDELDTSLERSAIAA